MVKNRKYQRGLADPLSLGVVAYLFVSLIALTAVTANPETRQLIYSSAKEEVEKANGRVRTWRDIGDPKGGRQAGRKAEENAARIKQELEQQGIPTEPGQTGGWEWEGTVNADPNAKAGTEGFDCSKPDKDGNRCSASAGKIAGYYEVETPSGLRYYAIGGTGNNPVHYTTAKDVRLAEDARQATLVKNEDLRKSCEADKAAGIANYVCNTPGGLEEYKLTNEDHKRLDLIKSCEADKAAGIANYVCNTPEGLQEYKIDKGIEPFGSNAGVGQPTPETSNITWEDQAILYNFLITGTSTASEVFLICEKIWPNCEGRELNRFASDTLRKFPVWNTDILLESYRERHGLNEPAADYSEIDRVDAIILRDYLTNGSPANAGQVIAICQRIGFSLCSQVEPGAIAATLIAYAPGNSTEGLENFWTLLEAYHVRTGLLQPVINTSLTPTLAQPGEFSQFSPEWANTIIPNTGGKNFASVGCGPTAVANILSLNGQAFTPEDIAQMIDEDNWRPGGLYGGQEGDLIKLLSDPTYNAEINFGYKVEPYRGAAANTWSRVGSNQIVWIGSQFMSDNRGNTDVAHITYMLPTNQKDVFTLQKNDYFGSNMVCQPGTTKKGDGFNCSNESGLKLEIPIDNQEVIFLTPPN